MSDPNDKADGETDYEEASSRATRARTRLIVEGFANLSLVAILFCGVQAQLISVTNGSNDNKLDIATNAVFFGGLIFSVFTALLATLSGRWFSILREDDADYLSSRWLAQDCAEEGGGPDLEKYLEFQIVELKQKQEEEKHKKQPRNSMVMASPKAARKGTVSSSVSPVQHSPEGTDRAASPPTSPDTFNPIVEDIGRIIRLLEVEKSTRETKKKKPLWRRIPNYKKNKGKRLRPGPTTRREIVLSWTLLSPLAVCCLAFALFCAGILMLAWNKQPRGVAIFTSATVLVCLVILVCFFLRHRHKHVIKNLYLSRPGL